MLFLICMCFLLSSHTEPAGRYVTSSWSDLLYQTCTVLRLKLSELVVDVPVQRTCQRTWEIFLSLNSWREPTGIWVSELHRLDISTFLFYEKPFSTCLSVCMMCFSPFRQRPPPDWRRHCHWQRGREERWPLHQPRLQVGEVHWREGLHSLLHRQPLL